MQRYNKIFKEDEDYKTDPVVIKIIKILRDNNFKNEGSRKELLNYLTTLHNNTDPIARKALGSIGDLFSDIGDDLLKLSKK
jgi:hypothetical protein